VDGEEEKESVAVEPLEREESEREGEGSVLIGEEAALSSSLDEAWELDVDEITLRSARSSANLFETGRADDEAGPSRGLVGCGLSTVL
jgi:hypothetical protein